jgi:hypothetical protein
MPSRAELHRHDHEASDMRLRPLIISGVSLALLAGLTLLAMGLLFNYFAASRGRLEGPLPGLEARQPPPEPRLQVSPKHDMQAVRAAEMALLHSYGWVNRAAGIVRIPIERAIDLLAERGLPHHRGSTSQQQDGAPRRENRQSPPLGPGQ